MRLMTWSSSTTKMRTVWPFRSFIRLLPAEARPAARGSLTSAGRSGDSEGAAHRHLRQSSKGRFGAPVAIWKLYEWIGSMLDLDLLRSFVSVVDVGGFTRAGERVHRTQSTVSQQIRRLEEGFGHPLLHRDGKRISPTEEGERLLSYARRLLALAEEAQDVVSRPTGDGVIRLGLPEDFAAHASPRCYRSSPARVRAFTSTCAAERAFKCDARPNAVSSTSRCSSATPKRPVALLPGPSVYAGPPAAVTRSISATIRCRSPYSSRDAFTAIERSMRLRG